MQVAIDRSAKMLARSEEHTSELQSRRDLVCRLLLEKKNGVVVGADREVRQAALADVDAVRSGNAEIEAEVVAVVRAGDFLVLDVGAEGTVEDEVRAQRTDAARGRDVDARVAEAAVVQAEREVVDDIGVEHREHAQHKVLIFFFNDTATTEIYTLSLHDALPI